MIDLNNVTILELQDAMNRQQISSRETVLWYLSRVATLDHGDEGLNAVLEINPDALFIADMLDAERQRGQVRSALHGIPVMLKDTINTADKMHTSAGSLALAENLAPYDAHVVTRLRDAGAVILGKTNMTEFANFMGADMPAGYSSRGGQVVSPFNRECSPSGSSTGSAVAVAVKFCMAALGTENFGSINYPAQQNGVVGLKPTMGLVSRYGNIPTTHTLDIIGPLTGSVADAAIVLGILAGRDEHDPATHTQSADSSYDYSKSLVTHGLQQARIGIEREKWEALTGNRQHAFARLLSAIEDAGAQIIEIQGLSELISESDIDPVFFYECKACLNAYLSTVRTDLTCTSIQDIIEFNQQYADQTLKYGQPVLLQVQNTTSGTLTEPAYIEALLKRERAIQALDTIFTQHRIDALLCTQCEIVAPITGFPSMSLPIGTRENRIPIGAYWIARRYDEATLLKVAYAAEQLLGIRCIPELLAHVPEDA